MTKSERRSLAPVTIRPATRRDLEKFYRTTDIRQSRIADVGVVRGRIIGCGGVAFVDGMAFVFLDLKPSARRYKVALVKAARGVIERVRTSGTRIMYANLDPDEPGAERWVRSMGFLPTDEPGLFAWRASEQ